MVQTGLKESAVLCVLRSGDAMLLLRRGKEPNRDKYVPIGGHIEPFESPKSAAIREVQEEAGVVLGGVQFRGVLVETSPTSYNWTTFIYSAEVARFDPPACREGSLEWVAISDLASIPTPPTDLTIYRLIAQGRVFVLNAEYDQALELLLLEDEISGEILHS